MLLLCSPTILARPPSYHRLMGADDGSPAVEERKAYEDMRPLGKLSR